MRLRSVVSSAVVGALVVAGLVAMPAQAAGPVAPGGLAAEAQADGTVHFEWAAVPGASGYRVEWSVDPGFATGTVTSVDTYALDYVTRWQPYVTSSTDLYWRVSAFGTALSVATLGDPSSTGLVTTGLESAPVPTSPGLADGIEEITYPDPTVFAWEPVPGAIAYQLEYTSDSLDGSSGITAVTVPGAAYTPANPLARVDNGGNVLTWKWHVRAQFYNGTTSSATNQVYGAWSAAREFRISWTDQPTNLYPEDEVTTVHSDLSFSWDAVAGAAKYRVTFGTAVEGSGENITILNPIVRDVYTTTYIPTAQVSDTTRFWQVTPLDYAGNLGTPSAVHQYRKKWGTQIAPSAPADLGDVAPETITGSTDYASMPQIYLSDLNLEWEPLNRATYYQVEVRDNLSNVMTCNTPNTSATIIAYYADGLDNSGTSQVLKGAATCLWNSEAAKRIQSGRDYNWRVRAVDLSGASSTSYQGSLPAGAQLSSWSPVRHFYVKTEDRTIPTSFPITLDQGAFTDDNPTDIAGQPAPLMTWGASGQIVNGNWAFVDGYEVILYKNPQRTAEIARFRTPSTTARINAVFADNTTANPYYASVRPIVPGNWSSANISVVGGIENETTDSFIWEKASHPLTGLATETLSDGSVRLSWSPQAVTGIEDGGSRGYQVRVYNGDVIQGIAKKVEFPFFMAQKAGSNSEGEFPSTPSDTPLPPGNNYSFDVATLDANGNPGPVTRSGKFSVGIVAPEVTEAAKVVGSAATVEWASVPGALKYSLQYRKVGTASWTTVANISQTAATINGLDNGPYEWQVRTHDASNQTSNVSAYSATQTFSVGAASSAIELDGTAVLALNDRVLRWTSSVEGATRFQVQFATDAAFSQDIKTYETVASSFAIPDALVAAKQYFWRVKALSEPVGSGTALKVLATSANGSFTARTTPVQVTGLKLTRAGVGLTASWTQLTGANAGTDDPITYVVAYREKSVTGDWSAATEVTTAALATSVTIPELTPGTTYEFRVAGKNTEGTGPWSTVVELATASAPLAAPTVTATPKVGEVQLKIGTVGANGNSPITGYLVSHRRSGDVEWTYTTIPVVSTYSLTGLINTTDYDIAVAAVNLIGTGPSTQVSTRTLGTPSAPQDVKVTRGDKVATITWAAPLEPNGTITNYVVEKRTGTTGTWTTAATVSGTTLTYQVKSLTNGTAYNFRVVAKTANGTGTYSSIVAATPAGKPLAPSSVKATSSKGVITVTWKKPSSNGSAITSFLVKYSTNNKTWYTLKTTSASTLKVTTTKGTKGKKVYFKVYAKNALGYSVASSTASVTRK
ncbi:fibronectin type III domain-containing protein [Demequina sp.]|uniref:fibronectin type III domain-containing protein n=1 Tax=Demequina sp. TaxID=2050685 RepID=UPI003D13D152